MTVAAPIVADSAWGLSKTAWGSTRATRGMLSRRGGRGGANVWACSSTLRIQSIYFFPQYNHLGVKHFFLE